MQPPGCTRCCGCNERSKRQMLEWDVWAWESPAWAEATSIVNCPITRLSLFRTGRGGGEQRMGQGGGHNSERARMMSDRASRLCGFHREPGFWPPAMRLRLRYLGRLRGRWGPFFPELSRLGCHVVCRTRSFSSWAGAERCEARQCEGHEEGHDEGWPRVSVEQPQAATPFACARLGIPTDMSACSAAVSHREKLKEGGA